MTGTHSANGDSAPVKPPKELLTRSISALVLGGAVLFITWWNFYAFCAMCAIGGFILAKEWWGLTRHRSRWFILIGTVYLCAATLSLMLIYFMGGHSTVFFLFAIVWGGDIAAYLIGRKFGKHKIAPSISPGKSWEGLTASIVASIAIFFLYGSKPTIVCIVMGVILAIVGLLGDLFESSLKRKAGVKDSGTLIPGHGGLFDRVDALLPCAVLFAIPYILLWFSPCSGQQCI